MLLGENVTFVHYTHTHTNKYLYLAMTIIENLFWNNLENILFKYNQKI